MVERFDVESGGYIGPSGDSGGMVLAPAGDFVRHSDYAALEAQLVEAIKERDEYKSLLDSALKEVERAQRLLVGSLSLP